MRKAMAKPYSIKKGKGGYSVFWKHPLSVSGWFATKQDAVKYAKEREAGKYKERAYKNPLPVGRYVKVKAIRRKNGRVDLYRA